MKKFTHAEKNDGELSVRDMSIEAQTAFNGTDRIAVYKYVDYEATAKAEEKAFEEEVDFFPGDLDVIRYAVDFDGDITLDLTFEQVEKYFEEIRAQEYDD